jgi:hypothetical protein
MTPNNEFGEKNEDNRLIVYIDQEQFKGLCILISACTVMITVGIVYGLRYVS